MAAQSTSDQNKLIAEYRERMEQEGKNYLIIPSEDNGEDYVNFYFIGNYEGKEVLFDTALYTLRVLYHSELFELAEHKAAQKFPNFRQIQYEEDENGDMKALSAEQEELGLYMAEIMMDLEDEEAVKVQEHVLYDPNLDVGVGLDVSLNVPEITDKVIAKFVQDFNADKLELDDTLYSFVEEEEEADS